MAAVAGTAAVMPIFLAGIGVAQGDSVAVSVFLQTGLQIAASLICLALVRRTFPGWCRWRLAAGLLTAFLVPVLIPLLALASGFDLFVAVFLLAVRLVPSEVLGSLAAGAVTVFVPAFITALGASVPVPATGFHLLPHSAR